MNIIVLLPPESPTALKILFGCISSDMVHVEHTPQQATTFSAHDEGGHYYTNPERSVQAPYK